MFGLSSNMTRKPGGGVAGCECIAAQSVLRP
jgi:hypothetical protein